MITGGQMRAARALLKMDRKTLASKSGLSMPTIQRMEASENSLRSNVESLEKIINVFSAEGIELIGDGATSLSGGRGVRLMDLNEKK